MKSFGKNESSTSSHLQILCHQTSVQIKFFFRNVKESLSWLLQHSKHDQALKMLKEIAKVNKKTLKKNDEEYLIDNIEHTKVAKS